MSTYIVEGGRPLEGSVRVHGAKNSVLPILAACLLAPGECVIHNCPELSDVRASWIFCAAWAAGRSGRGRRWWWTPPPPRGGRCPTPSCGRCARR